MLTRWFHEQSVTKYACLTSFQRQRATGYSSYKDQIVNRFHCLLLSKVCFLKKNRYNAYQGGMLSENEIDLKQTPFYNYENSPNWYNAVFYPGKTPSYIPFEIFKQTRCASCSKPHSQKDSQQHIYEFLLNISNYLLKKNRAKLISSSSFRVYYASCTIQTWTQFQLQNYISQKKKGLLSSYESKATKNNALATW